MSELPAPPPARPPQPWATYLLLAVNIGVFVAMVVSGISIMKPTTDDLIRWGADVGALTLNNQPWRAVTSSFLHIGLIHLLLNMWCLINLGRMLEMIVGGWNTLLVYLATGIGSALASLTWDSFRVSAGASGSIFGITGVLLSILYFAFPRERVRPLLVNVAQFAGINLVYGLVGGVDNMAHLGGLISGLLIGFFLSRTLKNAIACTAILVCAIAVASALLLPLRTLKADTLRLFNAEEALEHGDTTSAISLLQVYTKNKPDDPEGHATLGYAFHDAKRIPEAIREYERALALRHSYPDVEVNLAALYHTQNRVDEAIKLYSRALPKMKPDARFYLDFAQALNERQRYAEAETQVRKAIALDDKDGAAHFLLARTLALQGKEDEAAREYKRGQALVKR